MAEMETMNPKTSVLLQCNSVKPILVGMLMCLEFRTYSRTVKIKHKQKVNPKEHSKSQEQVS
jgi:hypothetical protein